MDVDVAGLSPGPDPLVVSTYMLSVTDYIIIPTSVDPAEFPVRMGGTFVVIALFTAGRSTDPDQVDVQGVSSGLVSSFASVLSRRGPVAGGDAAESRPATAGANSVPSVATRKPPPLGLANSYPDVTGAESV